jgi:hypothetical protein
MKNLAAKSFLVIMAFTAFPAAAGAKTTLYDSVVNHFTTPLGGESTSSESANSLVNSFLGKPTCWLVWKFSDGQEIPVRIPCKKGK